MDDHDGHRQLRLELAALGHDLDRRLGEHDLSPTVERALRHRGTAPGAWLKSPRRRVAAVLLVGLVSVLAIPQAAGRDRGSRRHRGGADRARWHARTHQPCDNPQLRVSRPVREPRRCTFPPGRTPLHAGPRARARDLGSPDQVRFEASNGLHASLLYRARQGLPALPDSAGIGLFIEEFVGDGRTMVHKYQSDRTVATPVDVNGSPGVYLSGGPHLVFYEDALGRDIQAEGRTVGHALIFQHGDLTIRVEANVGMSRMVRIARSLG